MLINVTITRRVLSRAFPQCCKELYYFPCVIVLCCWRGEPTRSSGSLWCHSLFHSSVEIWSHYSSANVDPIVTCQRFLLRPALRTQSCLTLMDNSSSLCAQHAIWCAILTDRGIEGQFANADFRSIQCGKTFIKSSVPFFLSPCHISCTALSGAPWSRSHFISKACMSRSHDWCKVWLDN